MKPINSTHMKYIKWRDPEGLHQDTLQCISELQFIRNELDFLSLLIKEYTIEIISQKTFEKSKYIVEKLQELQKTLNPLLTKIKTHKNGLKNLMDNVYVENELENYKTEHYELMFEAISFNSRFKKLKKNVFSVIKAIFKHNKKKHLLN